MSPNAGGGGGGGVAGSQPMSTAVHNAHGVQINFGDLASYLTYGFGYIAHLSQRVWRMGVFYLFK